MSFTDSLAKLVRKNEEEKSPLRLYAIRSRLTVHDYYVIALLFYIVGVDVVAVLGSAGGYFYEYCLWQSVLLCFMWPVSLFFI